jgi:hypothetical protein
MANKRTFRGTPGRGYQAGKKNPGEKSKIMKDSDIVGKTAKRREVTRGERNKAISDFKKRKEATMANLASAKKSSSKAGMSGKKATTKTSTAQAGSNIKKKNFNVGVSKGGVSFNEAFRHFRKKGAKEFTWNGKRYTTEVK